MKRLVLYSYIHKKLTVANKKTFFTFFLNYNKQA